MRGLTVIAVVVVCAGFSPAARGGVVFGLSTGSLGGGYRWDAAPRNITISGVPTERSLNGGLRYSLQGGSYQAYRDLFTWNTVPSVPDFTAAVQQAFAAWTMPDPVTNLTTALSFVPDFSTTPVGIATGGVDTRGAEIDLFGSTDGSSWNPGSSGTQGETYFQTSAVRVTLTSGTTNYLSNGAIAGADIRMNSNTAAVYSLPLFRRILTHEIGHSIGLGDVEGDINPGAFIDDNLDLSTSATARATLTNSWALLVNTANPATSPLARYTANYADPGVLTSGVDILMESRGVGIGTTNPITNLVPLTNDDFGTRQFLYPSTTFIPEPSALIIALAGCAGLKRRR